MGIFGDFLFWSSKGFKKRLIEYSGGHLFMPINWNPFYDTSYDINVTLQLVSSQKDAYANEL